MYYLWLSCIILWFFFVTLFSLHGTNSLLQLANTKRKSCFLFKRHNYGVYYQVYKIDRQHNSKVHCLAYHAKNATCTLPSFCSHPLHFSECPVERALSPVSFVFLLLSSTSFLWMSSREHSHKVSGSMRSRYGVAERGTLPVRDFYTSGRKWTREPGSGSTNLGRGSKVVNPFYVTMVGRALSSASWGYFGPHPHTVFIVST